MEGGGRAAKHTQSREGSKAHSEPGGVVEGGGNVFQVHSEPGEVMEGGGRSSKHTKSREEWWRGAGGHPSTLRAGRSGGGWLEGCQAPSEPGGVVVGGGR